MKGHTYQEIADMKGITLSGMYRFIHRALKTINKAYLRYNMNKPSNTTKK
jgi:DNA-directed RNA polymerase specialized sigma24 family protein